MPRGWCRHVARNMSYKRPKTQPWTSHELLTAATLPPAPLRSARSEGRVLQFCRSLGCLISTGVAVNRNGFETPPVVPGTALVGLVIPALRILYDYSWFRRLCCFVRRLLLL